MAPTDATHRFAAADDRALVALTIFGRRSAVPFDAVRVDKQQASTTTFSILEVEPSRSAAEIERTFDLVRDRLEELHDRVQRGEQLEKFAEELQRDEQVPFRVALFAACRFMRRLLCITYKAEGTGGDSSDALSPAFVLTGRLFLQQRKFRRGDVHPIKYVSQLSPETIYCTASCGLGEGAPLDRVLVLSRRVLYVVPRSDLGKRRHFDDEAKELLVQALVAGRALAVPMRQIENVAAAESTLHITVATFKPAPERHVVTLSGPPAESTWGMVWREMLLDASVGDGNVNKSGCD